MAQISSYCLLDYNGAKPEWQLYDGKLRDNNGQIQRYVVFGNSGYWVNEPGLPTGTNTYFVDFDAAVDGDGSDGSPFQNFKRLGDYGSTGVPPIDHIGLVAGDVVYVRGSANFADDHYLTDVGLGGVNGRATLLTHSGQFTPASDIKIIKDPRASLSIDWSGGLKTDYIFAIREVDGFELRDIEVSGGAGSFLYAFDSQGVKVQGNDIEGVSFDNTQSNGLIHPLGGSSNWVITHNAITDCYDYDEAIQKDATNASPIILDQGTGGICSQNLIKFPVGFGYSGIKYKYGDSVNQLNASFRCEKNVILGGFNGIETSQAGSIIRENFIQGQVEYGIRIAPLGGNYYLGSILVENNTLDVQNSGIYVEAFNPTDVDITDTLTIKNNVVLSERSFNSGQFYFGYVVVSPDRGQTEIDNFTTNWAISIDRNLYYSQPGIGYWSVVNSTSDFATWQGFGFDLNGIEADPVLDSCGSPTLSGFNTLGYPGFALVNNNFWFPYIYGGK